MILIYIISYAVFQPNPILRLQVWGQCHYAGSSSGTIQVVEDVANVGTSKVDDTWHQCEYNACRWLLPLRDGSIWFCAQPF